MTEHTYSISPNVTRYETSGGDVGFVRYELVHTDPGVPGFSAPAAHRKITEAVFVTAADAALAEFVLACRRGGGSLAAALAARGIPYRGPRCRTQAVVLPLPVRATSAADAEEVA